MNERIKELADHARVQDRGYFIYQYGGPTGHQSVEKAIDLEKFAELVVQECLIMADEFELDVNRSGLVDRMKEHFGVAE